MNLILFKKSQTKVKGIKMYNGHTASYGCGNWETQPKTIKCKRKLENSNNNDMRRLYKIINEDDEDL